MNRCDVNAENATFWSLSNGSLTESGGCSKICLWVRFYYADGDPVVEITPESDEVIITINDDGDTDADQPDELTVACYSLTTGDSNRLR